MSWWSSLRNQSAIRETLFNKSFSLEYKSKTRYFNSILLNNTSIDREVKDKTCNQVILSGPTVIAIVPQPAKTWTKDRSSSGFFPL